MEEMVSHTSSLSYWRGKRVLVTGHSGFKGAWLTLWLHRLGADVTGISLPPLTQPNLYSLLQLEQWCNSHFCDIRDLEGLRARFASSAPQIVFHLAAQPLVRASYREPVETFATNVQGTVNVLQAVRDTPSVKTAVIITTDKVYRNRENSSPSPQSPYRESDELGGHDPYSASKAAAELIIASYHDSFLREAGVGVASARAGNVIGGGDWSEDRLLPDAIRAWQANVTLQIRRPRAIRPWQHVLEPLYGYLLLAQRLHADPALAGAYNFGPLTNEAATVRDVIERARLVYGRGETHFSELDGGPHEAGWLALETAKARETLGYEPRWSLPESVRRTVEWYRSLAQGASAHELCLADIQDFEGAQ